MSDSRMEPDCLALTAEIVAAHVGNNAVATNTLPDLIRAVHQALIGAKAGVTIPMTAPRPPQPAGAVKRSVFPDYIICLEDGQHLKSMKRHLRNSYNMTPDEYRAKWGLPSTYPMVAPAYAKHRSALAKKIGLGRKKVSENAEPVVTHIPARRARGSRG